MAQKPTKIVDVKRPDKITPGASGRPLVVTNRPVLTDPMMVAPSADGEASSQKSGEAVEIVNRSAKTIKPMDDTLKAPTEEADEKPAETAEDKPAPDPEPTAEPKKDAEGTPAPAAEDTKPEPAEEAPAPEPTESKDVERDPDAELSADEIAAAEAQAAREQELEQLIASGKYAVPIDAVQRKRSRMYVMLLCLLAVVLAVVLADAVLDAGLVKLSVKIPHTHFFSNSH